MSLKNTSYFNPTSVGGCSLWLDGADSSTIILSGSTVSQWTDKSTSGNHATQSTTGNQPSYASSGIVFAGNQWLITPIGVNPTAESFFIVFKTTNNLAEIFSGINGNSREVLVVSGVMYLSRYGTNPVGLTPNGGSVSTNTVTMFNYQYTSSFVTLNLNGTTSGSGTPPVTYSGTGTSYIGSSTYAPNNMYGSIYEIIYYNSSISDTQRKQIEGYLAWKWGLTSSIPLAHPYALVPSYGVPSLVPNAPAKTSLTYANHPVIAAGSCALWLDASDSSTISYSSGSNLSQWRDKSGNGYIMANNTGTTTVASAALNSYNAIYTPSGTSAKIASFTGRTKFTLFFVGKCAIGRYLLGFNSGFVYAGNDTLMSFTVSGNTFDCVDSIGLTNSVVSANTWFIFSIGYDNVAAFTPNPYNINGSPLNGANRTTITSPYIVPNGVPDQYTSNPFYINSLSTNSYDSDYTAEIIFYNKNLNVSQRQNIEGYLAQKWGLTANLPVGHPYKSTFPLYLSPTTGVRVIPSKNWSPLTPGNCSLWLDAADTSTVSGASSVTQWRDKSGNGRNSTSCSATYSTTGMNGRGCMTNPVISGPITNSGSSIVTIFIVGSKSTAGAGNYDNMLALNLSPITNYYAAGTLFACYYGNTSPPQFYCYMSGNLSLSFVGAVNTPFIFNAYQTGTTGSTYGNGTSYGDVGTAGSTFNYTTYYIGTCFSAPAWQGNIGEVIVYNSILSNPQRQQVEGYLAWKWGLKASLPSSHPYKLFPPSP